MECNESHENENSSIQTCENEDADSKQNVCELLEPTISDTLKNSVINLSKGKNAIDENSSIKKCENEDADSKQNVCELLEPTISDTLKNSVINLSKGKNAINENSSIKKCENEDADSKQNVCELLEPTIGDTLKNSVINLSKGKNAINENSSIKKCENEDADSKQNVCELLEPTISDTLKNSVINLSKGKNAINENSSIKKCENEDADSKQNVCELLEPTISDTLKNSVINLSKRKNAINEKLAQKLQQLQLQKDDLECNSGKSTENDKKVIKSLDLLAKKLPAMKETQNPSLEKSVTENEDMKLTIAKETTNLTLAKDVSNRDDLQRIEHLEEIVDGFQQLIWQMASKNNGLLHAFRRAARDIKVLKKLPVFKNIEEELHIEKRRSRRAPKVLKNDVQDDAYIVDKSTTSKKSKKNKTSVDKLARYIDKMLRDHVGDNQKEKLEKFKSLAEHVDDLEPLANALVEEGYGTIVQQEICINRKNNHQAFVRMSNDRDTNERDGMITLPIARRYAFDGDIVRAFVLNPEFVPNKKNRTSSSHVKPENSSMSLDENEELCDESKLDSSTEDEINDTLDTSMANVTEKDQCRKAFVIEIVKQIERREVVGSITFAQTTSINEELYYKLRPHDAKIPMIFIPKEMCEEEVKNLSKEDICGMLYVARVLKIDDNGDCIGELVQPVGKIGNIQAEIKAILLHNGLKDLKPFGQKYHEMFEGPMKTPSDEDLKEREDLRKKCIFTIDPLTAKDLDDAVSVEKLNDDEYEIGVHISDVSYYLEENSELDNLVKHRSTSVYLVNEVIHMLPTSLCFRCSLLPGEDKFVFSVFWIWHTEKEELSAPRFTRSIINSCSQFAYEHAQKIIDNPEEELGANDLPDLFNGWTPNDIKWRILFLHQLAQKFKAKRYENGAISINNPKLRFQLDPKTGEPLAFEIEDRKEANYLIEELMLLANQSVAKFIHDNFPENSILRHHSPPLAKSLKALKERLSGMDLELDITSSKTIYESMQRLSKGSSDPMAMEACLNALLTKPMARAKYFCSEGRTSEADFWHYALSIPIYTHFTSPIRRYPDIMVHRLLAAALNYCPPPQRTTDELHHLAKICNDQKLNAKNAGEESIELFFKRYIKANQSINLTAVVTEIGKHMVNVVTIETGHSIPISYSMQNCVVITANVPNSILVCEKEQNSEAKKLQLFSTVQIYLTLHNERVCGFFKLSETSNEDKILENNQNDNTPSTSSKPKRQRRSRRGSEITKKSGKENTKKGFLAFYQVKN